MLCTRYLQQLDLIPKPGQLAQVFACLPPLMLRMQDMHLWTTLQAETAGAFGAKRLPAENAVNHSC